MGFLSRLFGKSNSTNDSTTSNSAAQPTNGQYDILKKTDKLLLCAFLIEASPDASMGAFQKTVVIQASDNELKEKIRAQCRCSNSDVLIVPPRAWNPPTLRSVAQQELTQNFANVLSRAEEFLKRNGRADLNIQLLSKTGTVMPNPVSGKVFFIFKIDPLVAIDASSTKQAFLFHDKGHEYMKAGQLKNAYDSFEKALSLANTIISTDSKNPDAFFVKAVSSGLMGTIQMQLNGSIDKDFMPMSMEAWKNLVSVAPPNYNADRLRVANAMLAKYK